MKEHVMELVNFEYKNEKVVGKVFQIEGFEEETVISGVKETKGCEYIQKTILFTDLTDIVEQDVAIHEDGFFLTNKVNGETVFSMSRDSEYTILNNHKSLIRYGYDSKSGEPIGQHYPGVRTIPHKIDVADIQEGKNRKSNPFIKKVLGEGIPRELNTIIQDSIPRMLESGEIESERAV